MKKSLLLVLIAGMVIAAGTGCKKDNKKNPGSSTPAPIVFNYAFELILNGTALSTDNLNIDHFAQDNIINITTSIGNDYFMMRIKDTLQTGQIFEMTDDPFDSPVFFYYSDDPEFSGYLPMEGAQLKIIEHNPVTKEIKAVFEGNMQNQGSIVMVKNGKLNISY